MPPETLAVTDRTKHSRQREQGSTSRSDLMAVLGAAFLCHLGLLVDGAPMVLPTVCAPDGDRLLLHGSVASRSLRESPGLTVCVTVTHVDGLVLARSVFEHSVNYRSAMIYGTPVALTDPAEKLRALEVLSEHVAPGQWGHARQPSAKELAATTVLALPLTEASVKLRSGWPDDGDGPDAATGRWAGVLPLESRWGQPRTDPAVPAGTSPPAHVLARMGRDAFAGPA